MGIIEMESTTEQQRLWPLAITVDDLVTPLRVIVQMNQTGERRCGVIVERMRVTSREQHNITVLNPSWLGLSFDLQVSSTKAKDVEHALLASRKIIPPRRRKPTA